MHKTLLCCLAVILAACDTAAPEVPTDPAFIGTWVPVASAFETRVTSRIDQSVPDFSVRSESGLTVVGETVGSFHYLRSVSHQYDVAALSFGTTNPAFGDPDEGPSFSIELYPDEPRASLYLATGDVGRDHFWGQYRDDQVAYTFEAGRLAVPEVELEAMDGSGRTARVGGELRFPLVSLRAGEETRLHLRPRALEFVDRITFFPAGTARSGGLSGHPWIEDGAGTLVVGTGSQAVRYVWEIMGDELRLTTSGGECTGDCARGVDRDLFAAPESIEGVRYVISETYRRES